MKFGVLSEAIFVGIVLVIIGNMVGFFVGKSLSVPLPKVCKSWNKNDVMEISLFLTGFTAHYFFEYAGLNKYYCLHGTACKR